MLRHPKVDAVYVATPTGLHLEHGLRVLDAGKHLWCEKPMTHSHAATCRLFELAERNGVMAASGLMYKYHPQFTAIKRVLAEGAIGDLRTLSIRFGMPNLDTATFRDDPALGGGALLDLGCYGLSVAYQLFPELPVLKAAHVETAAPSLVDTDGWAVLQSHGISANSVWGMGRGYQNKLEAWGSAGVLVAERVFTKEDDYNATVLVFDRQGRGPTVVNAGAASGHRAMIDTFAARVGSDSFFANERREAEWSALMTERIASSRSG
jgi:NDP-hexose-3-ketoreductase